MVASASKKADLQRVGMPLSLREISMYIYIYIYIYILYIYICVCVCIYRTSIYNKIVYVCIVLSIVIFTWMIASDFDLNLFQTVDLETGDSLGPGVDGEICVRGALIMKVKNVSYVQAELVNFN